MLKPPVGVARPRDIFVDGSVGSLEEAEHSVAQALVRLTTSSRLGGRVAAHEAVTALSVLVAAHIRDATRAWAQPDDLAEVVADRDRLAERVAELEAELARRGPAP